MLGTGCLDKVVSEVHQATHDSDNSNARATRFWKFRFTFSTYYQSNLAILCEMSGELRLLKISLFFDNFSGMIWQG